MRLKLTRPIVFFDLETTGTNVTQDRIVEISMVKVLPDPSAAPIVETRRVNPGVPIPAEATAVHGITDADVASCRTFKEMAKEIAQFFAGCDIAGFNSNKFDLPMISEEFSRAGVAFDFTRHRFIDVQTIFHKKEQRTLVAAYKFYCGKNLEDAHSAAADTMATLEVLEAQLDRYPDLPADVEQLSAYSSQNRNVDLMGRLIYDEAGREVINFGKYKGKVAEEVLRRDPGYFSWILGGDFPQNTKDVFTRIKMRCK